MRELIGAISLARHQTYSRESDDLFEDLQLLPFNPLLALIFTTGEVTKGASELARKSGIIVYSGMKLAVFLADRGVGMVQGTAGVEFEPDAFQAWLDSSLGEAE